MLKNNWITIKNLNKKYRKFPWQIPAHILKDFSLQIYKNDRLAIIGPNGSGKTTLVEIIAGYKSKTSGNIEYSFEYKNSPYECIAIQFQENKFIKKYKVSRIYKELVKYAKSFINEEFTEQLKNILNIDSLMNITYGSLSGGQKQRINLFFSLIYNPKVLILDEFTAGLDIQTKSLVKELLLVYLNQFETSLILVSHDANEVFSLCDRIIFINNGQITGEVKDIKTKFNNQEELEKYMLQNINTFNFKKSGN
ncbi:ABC transporter ATP-binding protein [Mycoplasma phocoenae]|uniref:ABC transporter ATP-binding protein n=1 Tax=Mycoplasma phocoenae TaxID=754517 RepID=A0A858U4B2_9MOLU|nr:ABC transporter ATP-binding protein [Mycoplasma phocoenae]QJG66909.1 ABC transporter ATP-binding protein [Mycoplasma phocoenae]